jgi:hypothetical protein
MRSDMHKVIVERPRRRSPGKYRPPPWEKNADPSELPSKEGIRKRHVVRGESKELNENLAPLKRYLRKQVGRPWNAVYRDISARLRATSAVQQHVRDHVWDYVERHATLGAKGKVLGQPKWTAGGRVLRVGELYVHPRTGLLAVVKRRRTR